jgi:hypothetical protein
VDLLGIFASAILPVVGVAAVGFVLVTTLLSVPLLTGLIALLQSGVLL